MSHSKEADGVLAQEIADDLRMLLDQCVASTGELKEWANGQ